MNKRRWMISAGLIVAIGVASVFTFLPAKAKPINTTQSGLVEQTEYDLSFKIDGRIADLSVQEGQSVKKGDVLGQLEKGEWEAKVHQAQGAVSTAEANLAKALVGVGLTDRDAQAKVQQARSAMNAAQAKLDGLKNGARPEEISQLQAKLDAAQTAFTHAEDMYVKTANNGSVPQDKKDEIEVQYHKAKAELTAAQEQLDLAKKGARQEELNAAQSQVNQAKGVLEEALNGTGKVDLSNADVQLAEAQLAQARASLEEAETYLSYTQLVSPVDGIVIHRNTEPGEMVSRGFTAFTVVDPNDKWVSIYVPETEIGQIKAGDAASLNVPAIKENISGKILSINQAPEFAVKKATNYLNDRDIRSFQVKIRLTDKLDRVYQGMTVEWQGAANQ